VARITRLGDNPAVPIEDGQPPLVCFTGGRGGASEAGAWEFWTVYKGRRGSVGRCRPGEDPGARFRDMEGRPGYEDHWKTAASAEGIRRATEEDVLVWLNTHPDDTPFAQYCQIGPRTLRVVGTSGNYRLE
jgi:hypothetical protein